MSHKVLIEDNETQLIAVSNVEIESFLSVSRTVERCIWKALEVL